MSRVGFHVRTCSSSTGDGCSIYLTDVLFTTRGFCRRNRFENQLTAEREATLRYKGENGIMKKKFTVLTKDIEDQK
ncbi:unnamed protein product, partial [Ectocarpus sp. 12 AP-2014]